MLIRAGTEVPEPPRLPVVESMLKTEISRSPWKTGSDCWYPIPSTALPRPSSKFAPNSKSARKTLPSPRSVIWLLSDRSIPAKSRLVMKLTTPEIASAPYVVEAPPVSTSVRSSSATGMLLRSTTPPRLAGTIRRPSSRTTLRLVPRPRRLTKDAPPLPLLTCWPTEGTTPGISRRSSSATLICASSTSASPTVVTGADAWMLGLRIREPVTTISLPAETWLSGTAVEEET